MIQLRIDNNGLKNSFGNVKALITNTYNLFNVLFVFILSDFRTIHLKNNLFAFFLPLRRVAPGLFNDRKVRSEISSLINELNDGLKGMTYHQIIDELAKRMGFKLLLVESKLEVENIRNDKKGLEYVDYLLSGFLNDVYEKYLLLKEKSVREEDVNSFKLYLYFVIEFSLSFYSFFGKDYSTSFKSTFLIFLKNLNVNDFNDYIHEKDGCRRIVTDNMSESVLELNKPSFEVYFNKYKLELPEILKNDLRPLGLKGGGNSCCN